MTTIYTQQRAYEDKIDCWIESCKITMSSSESEKDTIQNGDMFKNKKAEANKKKPEKAKKTPKADSKKSAKDWTDEETTMLIEFLESKPCLWDVYQPEYSKRDIKEIAYSEMAGNFDTDIASIKQKLNNLRTRFGKELSKERMMMIMKMRLRHPNRGSPPSLKKNLIFSKNAQMLSLPTKQLVPIM